MGQMGGPTKGKKNRIFSGGGGFVGGGGGGGVVGGGWVGVGRTAKNSDLAAPFLALKSTDLHSI